VALNMHLNVCKDDNISLLLRKLALVEHIENTFDVSDVSQAIQMLDWQTAATDFNASPLAPAASDKLEQFPWVKSAQRADIPQDSYFLQQLAELKSQSTLLTMSDSSKSESNNSSENSKKLQRVTEG
jgi:hypothetical protein